MALLGTRLRHENDALERMGHTLKSHHSCYGVADPHVQRSSPSISSLAIEICVQKTTLKAAMPWCGKYTGRCSGQDASTPALTFRGRSLSMVAPRQGCVGLNAASQQTSKAQGSPVNIKCVYRYSQKLMSTTVFLKGDDLLVNPLYFQFISPCKV